MADLSSLSDQQLEQYRQVLTQNKPEVHSGFGAVGDALAGAGGSVAQHAVNVYDLLRKIPGADKLLPDSASFHQAIADATPDNTPSHIGKFLENVAEFAIPAGKAAKMAEGSSLGVRMAAQAGSAGATRAVQGGNTGEVADAAALGAAGPVLGYAAGYLAPRLTDMIKQAGPAVRDAAADIVGVLNPKLANVMRTVGKVAGKVGSSVPVTASEAVPAVSGVNPNSLTGSIRNFSTPAPPQPTAVPSVAPAAVVSSPASVPASVSALRNPEQQAAAKALADEMLKSGTATPEMMADPSKAELPDPKAVADIMRELPAGAPKALAKANYAGNQEPQQAGIVYDAAGRAAKSQNLATMLHDEGLASKDIANWDIKKLNAAARDRGMRTPFSMKSFGELVQQLRKMEGSK